MRVIAGKARHLKLKTMEGMNTRPTTDRVKETLFNMISFDVDCAVFLDLFSGSGAIAIEALSRGAKKAVLVENNRQALGCIKDNLKTTGLGEDAVVLGRDVTSAVGLLSTSGETFDIVFMDPPYGKQWERKVLTDPAFRKLCHDDTLIIVESDLDTGYEYLEASCFQIEKIKEYKTNKHTFIRYADNHNGSVL